MNHQLHKIIEKYLLFCINYLYWVKLKTISSRMSWTSITKYFRSISLITPKIIESFIRSSECDWIAHKEVVLERANQFAIGKEIAADETRFLVFRLLFKLPWTEKHTREWEIQLRRWRKRNEKAKQRNLQMRKSHSNSSSPLWPLSSTWKRYGNWFNPLSLSVLFARSK